MISETLIAIGLLCTGASNTKNCQAEYIFCVNEDNLNRSQRKLVVDKSSEAQALSLCVVQGRNP